MFRDEEFRADMIETESDAVTFYYACVVGNGIVWQTDRGLYKTDGTPAVDLPDGKELKMLNEGNKIARKVLADAQVDAQEVMDMCESILVCNLVLQTSADLEGLPSRRIKNYANEGDEQKKLRRNSHLWQIMESTLQICVPDFVSTNGGLAVPKGFHPVIDAYVASCIRRIPVETVTTEYTEDQDTVLSTIFEEGKRLADEGKIQPRDWIDPDSDDNDDDPFSSGMWA